MNLSLKTFAAFLMGGMLATGALAQTRPDANADTKPPIEVPGRVLSDAQPLPAEDRDSAGAVKLHGSPVRAEKEGAAGNRAEVPRVGREVDRVMGGPGGGAEPSTGRGRPAGNGPAGTPE